MILPCCDNNFSHSFSKKNRLSRPSEFRQVFSDGRKFFYAGMILVSRFSPVTAQNEAKIGFALPKKIIKLAHERKRLKRLAIEYFRHRKEYFRGGEFVLTLNRSFKFDASAQSKVVNEMFDKLWKNYLNDAQKLIQRET